MRDLCVMRVANSTPHAIDPSFTDTEHDRPDVTLILMNNLRHGDREGQGLHDVHDVRCNGIKTQTLKQRLHHCMDETNAAVLYSGGDGT
jgi:hypothetical protein